MPATSRPEPDVVVMVMGDVSSASPSGSDTTDLCRFWTNQDRWGEKHNKLYIKPATPQRSFFPVLEMSSDREIWVGVNQSRSAGDCQCSGDQVAAGWIREGCVSPGVLGLLPAASSHAGLSASEVSLSELMVPSGLAAAEALRMEKPGRLAPMGWTPPHAPRQRNTACGFWPRWGTVTLLQMRSWDEPSTSISIYWYPSPLRNRCHGWEAIH